MTKVLANTTVSAQISIPNRFNEDSKALMVLRLTNLIIIARILQRESHITPLLGIDLAAHALTVITTKNSSELIKGANIAANTVRALAFLNGTAEAPPETAFGLFAIGIHFFNAGVGISLCGKNFKPLQKIKKIFCNT